MQLEELDHTNRAAVRSLILAGLEEHWGSIDETLNPDLDNMIESYSSGRTLVVRDDTGEVVGTGTLMPHGEDKAEIVRMSVAKTARRHGVGRLIVAELLRTASDWGCSSVVLETSTAWTDAVNFYLSCSFVITHVEDDKFDHSTWFQYKLDD